MDKTTEQINQKMRECMRKVDAQLYNLKDKYEKQYGKRICEQMFRQIDDLLKLTDFKPAAPRQ